MSLSLDRSTLEAALAGYRQQLQQIETKMADLRRMVGHTSTTALAATRGGRSAPGKQKHRMSPEGRERIAAAQRARWAKAKKVLTAQE